MVPAVLLALALQTAPPESASQLDSLKQAYAQSCGDRAYGTFDDVCTQMGDQIRAYERESERARRRAPRPAPPPVAPASGASAAPAPAAVAAASGGRG